MADPAYIVDGVLTDGEAWVGIATTTLGSDTATVTFTSPDDGSSTDWSQFMDLVLIAYTRVSAGDVNSAGYINFNNDTGTNYAKQYLYGDGSSVGAASPTDANIYLWTVGDSAGANEFGASVVHMFDINSGKYKSVLGRHAQDSDGDGRTAIEADTWKSQAPISEIDITASGGNLLAGSSFSLFGILPRMVA